jgi:hypothetical protein
MILHVKKDIDKNLLIVQKIQTLRMNGNNILLKNLS